MKTTNELIDQMAEWFTNMIYEDPKFQEAQHHAGAKRGRLMDVIVGTALVIIGLGSLAFKGIRNEIRRNR